MSAQWSDETVELVAHAIHHPQSGRWDHLVEDERYYLRDRARVVLAVLADAGLLVEPGSETRTEWATQWPDGDMSKPMSEHSARYWVAQDAKTGVASSATTLVSRTIHTGPWTPHAAPPPGAAPVSASSAAPGVQGGVPGPTPP